MLKKILCTMTLFNSYVFGLEQTLHNNSHIHTAQHTRGISFNGVREINDGFYLGEMSGNGRLLSIVMERLDSDNIQDWKRYISVQADKTLAWAWEGSRPGAPRAPIHGGSGYFEKVLNEISLDKNEVWIAYITRDHSPKRIELGKYCCDDAEKQSNSFAKDIEMSMTVTSSPGALITSHMGIACTIETILNSRTKGISLDLHSFAAKVMLMRNPNRRYMVNAPVWAMEKIILAALPKATFVGTREMRKNIQDVPGITWEEFVATHRERIESDFISAYSDKAQSYYNKYSGNQEKLQRKCDIDNVFMIGPEGQLIIAPETLESNVQKKLLLEFNVLKNPYRFIGGGSKEILELMEQHPPILSVASKGTYTRLPNVNDDRVFTIFDDANPDTPFLTINKSNKNDHDWIFRHPFYPSHGTHYIVVDLLALANAKQLVDENS